MAKIKVKNAEGEVIKKAIVDPTTEDLMLTFLTLTGSDSLDSAEYVTLSKKAAEAYLHGLANIADFATRQMTLQMIGRMIDAPVKLPFKDLYALYQLLYTSTLLDQDASEDDEKPEPLTGVIKVEGFASLEDLVRED